MANTDLETMLQRCESVSGAEGPRQDLLDTARRFLTQAAIAEGRGDVRACNDLLEQLAHHVSDSWPQDEALGSDVLGFVQSRRRMRS